MLSSPGHRFNYVPRDETPSLSVCDLLYDHSYVKFLYRISSFRQPCPVRHSYDISLFLRDFYYVVPSTRGVRSTHRRGEREFLAPRDKSNEKKKRKKKKRSMEYGYLLTFYWCRPFPRSPRTGTGNEPTARRGINHSTGVSKSSD